MSGLEQTFYIMGIIFMGLTFLMIIFLTITVFIIRSKINHIHNSIESKVNSLTHLAERGGELSAAAGSSVIKEVKKAVRKAKK